MFPGFSQGCPKTKKNPHFWDTLSRPHKVRLRLSIPSFSVASSPSLSTQVYLGGGEPRASHLNSTLSSSAPLRSEGFMIQLGGSCTSSLMSLSSSSPVWGTRALQVNVPAFFLVTSFMRSPSLSMTYWSPKHTSWVQSSNHWTIEHDILYTKLYIYQDTIFPSMRIFKNII